MHAAEKILEGGFSGKSRGGAHLHWLYRLPDGRLLEMPFLPAVLARMSPLSAAGPRDALTAPVLERSPGVLGQTTFPATSRGGYHYCQQLSKTGVPGFLISYPPLL